MVKKVQKYRVKDSPSEKNDTPREGSERLYTLLEGIIRRTKAAQALVIRAKMILYLWLGQFESLERSLYFSTVTFTTLGYGDITLEPRWRLLSGLEAFNGVVLLGVTTAVVFAILLRVFQAAGIVNST